MRQPSTSTRQRILAAAVEMTTQTGWGRVTMPALAARAGVSRQSVYNEFGTKARLAEQMVLAELQAFLGAVDEAFVAHQPDAVAAIEAATRQVMDLAHRHGLLRVIVGAEHGADTELLPLLTSRGAGVQAAATEVLAARLAQCRPEATGLDRTAGVIVRLVLSQVTAPAGPADEVAREVAWVAARLLPASDPASDPVTGRARAVVATG